MNSLTFIPTKKTVLTLFILIIALFIVGTFLAPLLSTDSASRVSAAAGDRPLFGWAWSDNFGWISFTSSNCDTDNDGFSDGAGACQPAGTPIPSYGVIADSNGDLSGYAWSDNIGWVSFNPSEPTSCPSGACKAKLAGDNIMQGWARALSYGGGWDGWISLNGSNYGITLNDPDFEGFAWDASKNDPNDASEQAIGSGWIQFNPAFGGVTIEPQCSDEEDNDGDDLIDYPDDTDCDSANDNDEGGGGGGGRPQCSDEDDNDFDALIDENDPGCHNDGDAGNPDSYNPNDPNEADVSQCSDGIDNDGNGCADFIGGDTGCTISSDMTDMTESGGTCPVITPQCSDEEDNDGDGKMNQYDPGCYTSACVYDPDHDSEADSKLQCSNCIDDDGDGLIDYKSDGTGDPGCSSASDNREFNIGFWEI